MQPTTLVRMVPRLLRNHSRKTAHSPSWISVRLFNLRSLIFMIGIRVDPTIEKMIQKKLEDNKKNPVKLVPMCEEDSEEVLTLL